MALPLVERERLLGGNWKIRAAAGLVFNRAWCEIVDVAPADARRVRYWDGAATAGGGDWTVGVRMSRKDGLYYVEDVVRGQWGSGERERIIRQVQRRTGKAFASTLSRSPAALAWIASARRSWAWAAMRSKPTK